MIIQPRNLSIVPLLAALTSCYQGADDAVQEPGVSGAPEDDAQDAPRMPYGTSLFVAVTDPQGNPISRAHVTLPLPLPPEGATPVRTMGSPEHLTQPVATYLDRVEYRTDSAGHLLMEELERYVGGRLVARVEAPGYAPASVVLEGIDQGSHMAAQVVLVPVAAKQAFDSREGTSFEHVGLRVEIPANGVVDEFGGVIEGLVEMSVVPFDSTTQALEQPGPLQATRGDGSTASLRSLGMAEVSLWRDGMPLQLAPGVKAKIELPLPAALQDGPNPPKIGDEIPAWWYDLDAGMWREEGVGTVIAATGRPGELAWTTEVAHFTWWNVDEPWTDHSCLFVTVHKDGTPIQGVTVQVMGAWGESQPQVTDANGQACTAIKRSEIGTVYVGDPNNPMIPPFDVQGKPDAAACDGNGKACQPLPIDIGPNNYVCTPGSSYACKYTGPEGTEGVGICVPSTNFCNGQGQWDGCMGMVVPEPAENPNTPADDNCDGFTDDAVDAECPDLLADPVSCYDGPVGTLGNGECTAGEKKCIVDPQDPNKLIWGACMGAVPPDAEQCATALDEDCDGNPGCGETTWAESGGDVDPQVMIAAAVGSNGDVFVLGRAQGTLTFGAKQLVLGKTSQVVLVHMLPGGQVFDLKSLGTGLNGELEIAVRGNQQLFVTGTLDGAADLPGVFAYQGCNAVGSDAVDGVLVELNGTACVKTRVLGGADGPSFLSAVAVGGDRVYVAGAFGGTVGPLSTPPTEDDAFVVGLDATDISKPLVVAEQFATGYPSYNVNRPALAASTNGLAMAFAYGGIVTLAGENHVALNSNGSSLIALFDLDGVAQWAADLGDYSAPALTGYAVALDKDGALTVAADHGAGLRVSQWQDPDGAQWTEDLPDVALGEPLLGGSRLAVAGDRVVLNATKKGVPSVAYMHKWTAGGTTDWSHTAGGLGATSGLGVAVSPFDLSTFVVGRIMKNTVFPGGVQLLIGDIGDKGDGYVVRLQQ